MRAHQIMNCHVISVGPDTPIVDAANIMLREHISGLPVVTTEGRLVGILSEGDFLRRSEIGTQTKRNRWLQLIVGPGKSATDFVHERGRKVGEVMTADPVTVSEDASLEAVVRLMEKHHVKRLPVIKSDKMVGIVTRSNLLQAVASLARDIPDPTATDDHIRDRIVQSISKNEWRPMNMDVIVRDGIVNMSGMITDERARSAAIVAAENVSGVKFVHDHLCWVDSMSGLYLLSPEDETILR